MLAAGASSGEVVDSSETGFTSRNTVEVEVSPAAGYDALVGDVGRWWDAAHTYSGDSANLSIEDEAGGCFCERLPNGGSVQHLVVVYAEPGKRLRLRGALGPLQSMAVAGSMTFDVEASGNGATITLTYVVGGYSPAEGGLGALAEVVDGVLRGQLEGLARYVESP